MEFIHHHYHCGHQTPKRSAPVASGLHSDCSGPPRDRRLADRVARLLQTLVFPLPLVSILPGPSMCWIYLLDVAARLACFSLDTLAGHLVFLELLVLKPVLDRRRLCAPLDLGLVLLLLGSCSHLFASGGLPWGFQGHR